MTQTQTTKYRWRSRRPNWVVKSNVPSVRTVPKSGGVFPQASSARRQLCGRGIRQGRVQMLQVRGPAPCAGCPSPRMEPGRRRRVSREGTSPCTDWPTRRPSKVFRSFLSTLLRCGNSNRRCHLGPLSESRLPLPPPTWLRHHLREKGLESHSQRRMQLAPAQFMKFAAARKATERLFGVCDRKWMLSSPSNASQRR